jgi:predicted  nucleic acid-binding Zn-ribbon protein
LEQDLTIIKRVHDKLQRLLKEQQHLRQENERLRQSLQETRGRLEQQQAELESWKQKAEINQYATGGMDEQEKKQFEKRINAYLREIDRCIALLSE